MALDLPAWKQVKEAGLHPFRGDPKPPALRLEDMQGKIHELTDYKGEVVLVNFWATWCPPCVEEIPSMGRLARRLGGQGFTILGINLGEPKEQVARFLESTPADFPILVDEDGGSAESWSIRAYPTSFLVDREGVIRYAYFGALEWDSEAVIEKISPLL
jgi:thiol-disulfide isomerase/thioredoxin